MKKNLGILFFYLFVLLLSLTSCSSFDAAGYVKALLDNTYKGDSTSLTQFSKCDKEDIEAIYEDSIQKTCSSLLHDAEVNDTLKEEYMNFVKEMMNKADYQIGSVSQNEDHSYTVHVITRKMILPANQLIQEDTDTYIENLQNQINTHQTDLDESALEEQTYEIILSCYKEALNEATYEEPVEHSIQIFLNGHTYSADEDDLSIIAECLFSIE